MPPPRTALLVGATGLVGGHLLELLLASPAYSRLTALVRRPLSRTADKLTEHIVDFEHLAESSVDWQADDIFLCLGTTIAAAGSKERFRRVDHDYTVQVARMALERGAVHLALISSVRASPGASSFYLRVKGETERDVNALDYACIEVFRPSLLVGDRQEKRRGEAVGIAVTRALSFSMFGALRAYRPIHAERLAAAMLRAVLLAKPGRHVRSYDDILALSS